MKGRPWIQLCFLRAGRFSALGLADGVEAFDEHQPANDAQKDNITELDQQIDLSERLQVVEDHHTQTGADEASDQQHRAHPEVHGLSPQMRKHPRERRSNDLVGFGGHGDCWRDADEEEQWRHQEATTDAEHAGKHAYDSAQPQKEKGVDRDFSDGEIYLHVLV